jgi:acetyl-CoA acetyltransferase family protein
MRLASNALCFSLRIFSREYFMAREAVIVGSLRTGLTKAHRGSFNMTEPVDYLAHTLKSVVDAVPDLDPGDIEDVIVGCGFPEGCQGMNMARIAAMAAGFPLSAAATTVNRFCSSGSQAIMMAAHSILNEGADVAIGAGVETITMMQDGTQNTNRLGNKTAQERFPGLYFPMGLTAEIVAERYGISREDQDAYALQSQQRYSAAVESGAIPDEIAPMKVTRKIIKKDEEPYDEEFTVERDECNRAGTTLEGLAKLKPVFKPAEEGGSVTAGNASQLSDGASATLLMSSDKAKELGVEPLGIYRGTAVAGCAPEEMGIGPVYAVPKLLERNGLRIDDIDIVELNEAFASQLLYCQRTLEIDGDRLNPQGGSIAIGHPFGMTGSRMTGSLLRQLKREGKRYGIVTMCIGGGQGLASLFEVD